MKLRFMVKKCILVFSNMVSAIESDTCRLYVSSEDERSIKAYLKDYSGILENKGFLMRGDRWKSEMQVGELVLSLGLETGRRPSVFKQNRCMIYFKIQKVRGRPTSDVVLRIEEIPKSDIATASHLELSFFAKAPPCRKAMIGALNKLPDCSIRY